MAQILMVVGLWLLGQMVFRLLFIFGVGFVLYSGFEDLSAQMGQVIIATFGPVPATVAQVLSMFGVDEAISIALSGASIIAAIKGAVAVKKLIFT